MSNFKEVKIFMETFGQMVRIKPQFPDEKTMQLRFDLIQEELNELEEAMLISPEAMEEELGDVLFTLVNFSRRIGVDPEQALSMACEKFISRFNGMEKMTLADGIKLTDLSSAEFELLWQQQKNKAPNF